MKVFAAIAAVASASEWKNLEIFKYHLREILSNIYILINVSVVCMSYTHKIFEILGTAEYRIPKNSGFGYRGVPSIKKNFQPGTSQNKR